MKTILPTFVGIPLLAFFGIGLTDQADAASTKQRGDRAKSSSYSGACARASRAARRAHRRAPRGYLPVRRGGPEYDFPRFGTKRWWHSQQDR
jgi:hypothetical protein